MSDRPLHLVPIGVGLGTHFASSTCPCQPRELYRDLATMRLAYIHNSPRPTSEEQEANEPLFSNRGVNTRAISTISLPQAGDRRKPAKDDGR